MISLVIRPFLSSGLRDLNHPLLKSCRWTATPLLQQVIDDPNQPMLNQEIERGAMPRAAHVDEIADAIVFLASPLSSFMQGASLVVDGGFTLT